MFLERGGYTYQKGNDKTLLIAVEIFIFADIQQLLKSAMSLGSIQNKAHSFVFPTLLFYCSIIG